MRLWTLGGQMTRFILLTFALLGWAFWELSGGADYQPRQSLTAAEPAATEPIEAAEAPIFVDTEADLRTAGVSVGRVRMSTPLTTSTRQVTTDAENDTEPKRVSAFFRTEGNEVVISQPEITLVSLEQSASRFAQPLSQLNEDPETSAARSEAISAALEEAQQTEPTEDVIIELPTDIRTVQGTRVNMRAGPGTQFEVLTRLGLGDQVVILSDPGNGWLRLRQLSGDQIGWISASLLSKAQP